MVDHDQGDVKVIGYVEADDIQQDPMNANLGTDRGMQVIEDSLGQLGAGRSILLDKKNTAIAGNKTLEKWQAHGGKVFMIETDGNTLVAVRRRDTALDEDPLARTLATMDNRAGEINLSWDYDALAQLARDDTIDLSIGFSAVEIEDILGHTTMPDLGAMDDMFDDEDDDEGGEDIQVFKLLLSQALIDRYEALVNEVQGNEADQFAAMLDWAEQGKTKPE